MKKNSRTKRASRSQTSRFCHRERTNEQDVTWRMCAKRRSYFLWPGYTQK